MSLTAHLLFNKPTIFPCGTPRLVCHREEKSGPRSPQDVREEAYEAALLLRRPCTPGDISAVTGMATSRSRKYLDDLVELGRVEPRVIDGRVVYEVVE